MLPQTHGKNFPEDAVPERQPDRRLERACGRAQDHVGEEHAADPERRGEDMEREEERHRAAA